MSIRSLNNPVVMYGMGNGAKKLLDLCKINKIKICDIFASDEFARGNEFCGFKVLKYSDIVQKYGNNFTILLAFGTNQQKTMQNIIKLSKKHRLFAPDIPLFGDQLIDHSFIKQQKRNIDQTLNLLSDDISKKIFAEIIRFKLSGNIDCLTNFHSYCFQTYEIIKPTENEIFVDSGAYNGDSIREFIRFVKGKYKRIIALEPDNRNYRKLLDFVENNGISNTSCYNKAVYSSKSELKFSQNNSRSSCLEYDKSDSSVESETIDHLLNIVYSHENPVTLKFDVEGVEKNALLGAVQTIINRSPKMILSAYHRSEDLFKLPLLVNSINPNYNIYLRSKPYIPAWDFYYIFTPKSDIY